MLKTAFLRFLKIFENIKISQFSSQLPPHISENYFELQYRINGYGSGGVYLFRFSISDLVREGSAQTFPKKAEKGPFWRFWKVRPSSSAPGSKFQKQKIVSAQDGEQYGHIGFGGIPIKAWGASASRVFLKKSARQR